MSVTWVVPATVVSVVDGDTVHLLLDLGWHISYETRARIAHINAAEIATPEGKTAKAYAQTLLPGGAVVTFHSHSLDKYGRPLGDITLADDRTDFGQAMVAAGMAVPYEGGAR